MKRGWRLEIELKSNSCAETSDRCYVRLSSSFIGLVQKIVNWYILNSVKAIFAGAWDPVSTEPLPPVVPLPKDKDVSSAWSILKKASKPVFVLGSQVTLPPVNANTVKEALEVLGVPCFLGNNLRSYSDLTYTAQESIILD